MYSIFIIVLFLFSTLPYAHSQKKKVLSLDEAISYTLKNNVYLLEAEQSIVAAKQQVREARLLFLPRAYFSGDISRSELESPAIFGNELSYRYLDTGYDGKYLYGLRGTLLQPLYTGGRISKTLELSKAAYKREKIKYEAASQDVVYRVKKHFYSALFYKNLVREASQHYAKLKEVLSKIGKSSEYYTEALNEERKMKDSLDEAGVKYETAILNLLETMNMPSDGASEVDGKFEPVQLDSLDVNKSIISAMERSPELRGELYQAQMDNISVNLALMRKYPNFYLGISYDVFSDSYSSLKNPSLRKENFITYFSAQFPLPYDLWTNIQRKKANERHSELRRMRLEDAVKFEVMRAYKNYEFHTLKCSEYAAKVAELAVIADGVGSRGPMAEIRTIAAHYEFRKGYLENIYGQINSLIDLEKSQVAEILPRP